MQKGIEVTSELVVSRGDAAKLLEPVEESLDEIPGFVTMPIDGTLRGSITPRGNNRLRACLLDGVDQLVTIVAFVGHDSTGVDVLNERSALGNIRDLAPCEYQPQRIAQRIDTGVNLGCQSAPRTTDRLIATVFFGAPAACWCARTIVASINSSSRSAWSCKASATRCQTPYASQRAKRTYTECQLPSSLGKSRHGQPVRARYRTASTKRRLSGARPPLSVGLPGNRFSIRNHCPSLSIRRSMCSVQKTGYNHKTATVNSP